METTQTSQKAAPSADAPHCPLLRGMPDRIAELDTTPTGEQRRGGAMEGVLRLVVHPIALACAVRDNNMVRDESNK